MPKARIETWLALIVGGIGLLILALAGLWVFMSATATPLHPDPQAVPSTMHAPPSPEWGTAVARARHAMRAALSDQNLPGLSAAVGLDGAVVWAEGFGWADLGRRVPVAPDTRFRIGTLSVPLTAAAVALLLEQGQLTLDAEIQTYVPEFPRKPWPVTLRQLMSHVAGVRNDGGDEGPLFAVRCERPVDALPSFANRPLLFEPGTGFRYSSYGWILVSAAVEAAAGEPFLRFMRRRIFEPLGMDDTRADPPVESVSVSDRATSYFPRFVADPQYGPDLMRNVEYSCYAGASAFVSTPSDLVRFGMAVNSGALLRPTTVDLLQTPQQLISGVDTGYGLGWDLETVTLAGVPTRSAGHDGTLLGGTVASLLTFRDPRMSVAVVANISYADTFAVASRIAEAFAQQRKGTAAK